MVTINLFKHILLILKIGSNPITFVYPIPLASFVAFSLSGSRFDNFIVSVIFCFFFITAINLFNHLNDLEEDIKSGRKYALFILNNKRLVFLIVLVFYILSTIVVVTFSKDLTALSAYILCAIFTWVYSDKRFTGRFIRRFKEWYITELLTYLIVSPSFFITLWSFFLPISEKGFGFSLLLSLFYISGMFLKDIKDISSDLNSGYRTLGIVYEPTTLLKISIMLNITGNTLIFIFSMMEWFPRICAIAAGTTVIPLYVFWRLDKSGWEVSNKVVNVIELHPLSYLVSQLLVTILAFISNL